MADKLHIDIETWSSVDIKSAGHYKYIESPDFEILILCYAINDSPVVRIDMTEELDVLDDGGQWDSFDDFLKYYNDPKVEKWAHNATFERNAFRRIGLERPIEEWHCSAVKAAYCGYPLSLEAVSSAMGLGDKSKLATGKSLIRYFSIPCKPTKVNGGRTRNLPEHDPEKWEQYIEYCAMDVEAEREITHRLEKYKIPAFERKMYILDQEINDRGILIDTDMAATACEIVEKNAEILGGQIKDITGVDNPNSGAQLRAWLSEAMNKDITSLAKDVLPALIEEAESPAVKKVLQLRTKSVKTSNKKYQAMLNCVGDDGRGRGFFQHYGAMRTGRWAGRIVQLQNLPRNYLRDMALAREVYKTGDYDMISMFFDNIPDILSQLIRTAFIAKPGHTFAVADFSAIEARVIAWLAGEKWRMDVFKSHGKIYEASASMMFDIPIEQVTKGSEWRQKGKVAELACIAQDELVLTDKGLIPIQEVTKYDKLWDGVEWVSHEGVIFKGIKKVISYEGLTATEDHIVWVEGKQEPIQFGEAATSRAYLLRSGDGRKEIRMGESNLSREAMGKELGWVHGVDGMYELQECSVVELEQPSSGKVERMPKMFSTETNTEMVNEKIDGCKTTLRESERQRLSQLWRSRNRVQVPIRFRSGSAYSGNNWLAEEILGDRPGGQQQALRTRKFKVSSKRGKSEKQKAYHSARLGPRRMALFQSNCRKVLTAGFHTTADICQSKTRCEAETQELAKHTGEVRTYDIINAGPRHRFTVSNVLVHNCGYGGGVGALKAMGAEEEGLTEAEMKDIIYKWRDKSPRIVKLWKSVENAAKQSLRTGKTIKLPAFRNLKFAYDGTFLTIELPSGRRLFYVKPRFSENRFGGESIKYQGMDQMTKKWGWVETFGGKIVENITQGIARDLLAEAMLRLDASGFDTVMHVHDEIVAEVPEVSAGKDLDEILSLMAEPVEWAKGLPLPADGYVTPFYMKD